MFTTKSILLLYLSLNSVNCETNCNRFAKSEDLSEDKCELTPQTYTGPFFIKDNLIRSNIREYRPGIPLKLSMYFIKPVDTKQCKSRPIPNLWIVLWQCDAIGYYSHFTKNNPTVTFASEVMYATPTDHSTFLRGAQRTDRRGRVVFNTVLPGWYANRTRHIHFRIYRNRITPKSIFTGQLYFTEEQNDWIYGVFPYYVQKRVPNDYDYIYSDFSGNRTTIYNLKAFNESQPTNGFFADIVITISLNSTDFGINGRQTNDNISVVQNSINSIL